MKLFNRYINSTRVIEARMRDFPKESITTLLIVSSKLLYLVTLLDMANRGCFLDHHNMRLEDTHKTQMSTSCHLDLSL